MDFKDNQDYTQLSEVLKQDILQHFDSICKQLQNMFMLSTKAYKTLWLLYEPYFFQNTMGHLRSFYRDAYCDSCNCLISGSQNLSEKGLHTKNDFTLPKSPQDGASILKVKFKAAFSCIDLLVQQVTPMSKLEFIYKCLTEIVRSSEKADDHGEETDSPGADELLDDVVLVLCNCDTDTCTDLFIDVKLLIDLTAPFLQTGPHSYSLTTFYTAFEFLLDKLQKVEGKLSD